MSLELSIGKCLLENLMSEITVLIFDLKQKCFHPLSYKTKCYVNGSKKNLRMESYRVPLGNKILCRLRWYCC